MVVEKYRAFVANTRTGKLAATLPVTSPSWGQNLNAPGPIEVQIPVESEEVAKLNLRALTQENRMTLGYAYGQTILEAGPILERDYSDGVLTVVAEGLWTLMDVRKVLPQWAQVPRAAYTNRAVLRWENKSLRAIARHLVELAVAAPPWNSGELPIVLPFMDEAGTHERTYNGFDLRWIGEALRELTEVEGGPDIRFRPRFRGDDSTYMEWVLELGNPLLQQVGPKWRWDETRPDSKVVIGSANVDGRSMAARTWRPGQGQEQDMPLGQDTNERMVTEQGLPWMETDTASKQEPNLHVLDSLAKADLAQAAGPIEQFTVKAQVQGGNGQPAIGHFLPGDLADVVVAEGHPLINPGLHTVRIMAISGDDTEWCTVTVAARLGSLLGAETADKLIQGESGIRPAAIIGNNTIIGYHLVIGNGGTSNGT